MTETHQAGHAGPSGSRSGALAALGLGEEDLCCPICMAILTDPFVTSCGHSFCFSCITTHLHNRRSCPSCSNFLTKDHIFPNFLLNKVISKAAAAKCTAPQSTAVEQVQQLLSSDTQTLKLNELNSLLQVLWERKQQLEQQEAEANLELLLHFLHHSREEKVKKLRELQGELSCLERDIVHVEDKRRSQPGGETATMLSLPPGREAGHGQLQPPAQQQHVQHQLQYLQPLVKQEDAAYTKAPAAAGSGQVQRRPELAANAAQPLSGMPGPPGPLEAGGQVAFPARPPAMHPMAGPSMRPPPPQGLFGPTGQHLSASVLGLDFLPPPEVLARAQADAPFQPQQHQQWQELRSHEEAESQWQPAAQPLAGMHWQQQAEQAQHTREQGERAGPAAEPFFHAPVGSSRPGVAGGYNIIQHQHTHLPQILGTGAVARASGDGLNSFQNAPPGLNSQQQSGTFHAASWPAGNGSSNAASYGGLHTQGLEEGAAASAGPQSLAEAAVRRNVQATQNPTGATGQPVGHSNATDSGTRTGTGTVCEDGMDTSHHERSDSIPNEQLGDMIRAKKRRLASQFDDLQQCYLRLRKSDASAADTGNASAPAALAAATAANGGSAAAKGTADGTAAGATKPPDGASRSENAEAGMRPRLEADADWPASAPPAKGAVQAAEAGGEQPVGPITTAAGLAEFSRMLSVFTHCGKLKVIAQLPRASTRQSSSILSSIEFDRDSQVFATAGVSKRISIFEYAAVMNNPHADVHCPAMELVTRSKLSCLAWNKYIKSHLISSDYEGVVTLWDVNSSQMVMEYEAHEKRIWSVDFCHADPMLLVSGSDDGWVKVWSTKQANSVCEIDMKANVCCVKYNPGSMYEVAIGSADHNVHLYDLRKTHEAVYVFSGHRKAVSYVRYLNSSEVVSASTDSTLRLWNTQGYTAARTYSGHVNEKNFVGLSADSEFVACGSESNEVFVYYKAMSKPIARRLFSSPATPPAGAAPPVNQDTSQFISAVCWKPYSQVLLAANSQGTIKVMQLTS